MPTFKLVQDVAGDLVVTTLPDRVSFIGEMEVRGFAFLRLHYSPANRIELQGQPVFAGLYGPMWDGLGPDQGGVIRYEDPEANRRLSA